MAIRSSRSWILAVGATGLCLPISVCGAGDTQVATKSDETNSFRNAVLERFDTNHNGRLDSKEKAAATRVLAGRDNTDEGLNDLREQILSRFDKNGNGKLERQEIRAALASVNAKSSAARGAQRSEATESTETVSVRDGKAAIVRDPEAPLVFAAQQLMSTGMDAEMAQAFAFQKFDVNGDGVLDQSELAAAQAALLQQLAQSSATTATPLSTALATSTTGTTSTGTGTSTTSGSSGMSGGCGSGSSGTTGSGTTTGSTQASIAQAANNQALGNLNSARTGGFGGGFSLRRGR
jgi:Ca2+-binding EF-hand superfamily protein